MNFHICSTEVMTAFESMEVADDFGAVLKAFVSGNLLDNIALLLLLDVVTLLMQSTCHSMRYSQTSKDFWLEVSKLFKEKCPRFFKRERNAGISEGNNIHTVETRKSDHL